MVWFDSNLQLLMAIEVSSYIAHDSQFTCPWVSLVRRAMRSRGIYTRKKRAGYADPFNPTANFFLALELKVNSNACRSLR